MGDQQVKGVIPHASVTVEATAELTNVSVETLREWAGRGAIEVERRGDMEIVRLEDVRTVASRQRASRFGALRERLRDADPPSSELVNIIDLQELARQRDR